MRKLSIHRLKHSYKELNLTGLTNAMKDNKVVSVYIDGEKKGELKDFFTTEIDCGAHTISQSPISMKFSIPAGEDNVEAFYFNDAFQIGMEHDRFRDSLVEFVLKIVRGQGFRDRILDPNNLHQAVDIKIYMDHLCIAYQYKETKGLKQWLTGGSEEKILYSQVGLCPPDKSTLPGSYWFYLDSYVQNAIVCDPEADLTRGIGGYTFRKTHSLY